jgi:MFS family permease
MEQEQNAFHWWPTCGVMLGALTVSLTHGVLNVAVPSMMSILGTGLDLIQWIQTVYQITQAVVMPAVGWSWVSPRSPWERRPRWLAIKTSSSYLPP